MTLTAATIIDDARSRHPAFDTTRTPNKAALTFLSAYVRELHGKVVKISPDSIREEQSVTMPLADHAAGIALTANRTVHEVVAFDVNDLEYPIDLIPATSRLDINVKYLSAWQVGTTLYLTSPADLWQRVVRLGIAYAPIPDRLTALTDSISLPDTAELCLTEKVAAFMALRVPKDMGVDAGVFRDIAGTAEATFLDDILNRLSGQLIVTRDVYTP